MLRAAVWLGPGRLLVRLASSSVTLWGVIPRSQAYTLSGMTHTDTITNYNSDNSCKGEEKGCVAVFSDSKLPQTFIESLGLLSPR